MSTFQIEIFSPRWGHNDTYTIKMTNNQMTITAGARSSTAINRPNLDPQWTGEELSRILSNDSITAPDNLKDVLEHAWEEWRNGNIKDPDLQNELEILAAWINAITQHKPKSQFWTNYF
ncbi:hypothetical protein [Marinomonas shanghaiensis]|uniref:hypothetical protein n=1 Tax=Marinomonas shanghaiensis TaxID=2202418 RepID=UPI000DB90B2E|nr:hypothetical protein [Marinomonas shanghaiensis]